MEHLVTQIISTDPEALNTFTEVKTAITKALTTVEGLEKAGDASEVFVRIELQHLVPEAKTRAL